MPRKLTRIGLIVVLMLGVIAMHSFGHTGHGGDHGQIVVTEECAHHGHTEEAGMPPMEEEPGPSGLLSILGLMVCGAIIARIVLEFFRSAACSRFRDLLVSELEQVDREPSRPWLPPPRWRPTGVQINRIAVLRI